MKYLWVYYLYYPAASLIALWVAARKITKDYILRQNR